MPPGYEPGGAGEGGTRLVKELTPGNLLNLFFPTPAIAVMLSHFKSLKSYIQVNSVKKVAGKSPSLLLYQLTAVALFVFSILVSGIQYFGEPIQCVQDKKDDDAAINERVMNSFCFISSTYTISGDDLGYGCGTTESFYLSPGIGPNTKSGSITRHSYYIWIPFVLFLQALTFLVPRSFWSYYEGGLIDKLLSAFESDFLSRGKDKEENIQRVCVYFVETLKSRGLFSFGWLFSDIIGFAIGVGNFFLTDALLGGRFLEYGVRMLSSSTPVSGKCTFYKFGAGGSLQNFDSLCVMALNVVNEKIYIILWYWFFVLVPASLLWSLFKIGGLICFNCLSQRKVRELLELAWVRILIGIPNAKPSRSLSPFVSYFASSDWIFFFHLVSGMHPRTYTNFVTKLEIILGNDSFILDGA